MKILTRRGARRRVPAATRAREGSAQPAVSQGETDNRSLRVKVTVRTARLCLRLPPCRGLSAAGTMGSFPLVFRDTQGSGYDTYTHRDVAAPHAAETHSLVKM